jgi:hypothetical protein
VPRYRLETAGATWSTKPTKVTRSNGSPVGELAWEGLTHSEKVTLNGRTYEKKQLMERKKEGLGSRSKWAFTDDQGKEYTWDGLTVGFIGLHLLS